MTLPRTVWGKAIGSDVFEFVTSGSRGWAQFYSSEGASFIRVGNLDHGTIRLDLGEVQKVRPPDGAEGERTKLKANDVLISITAEIGMVGVVPVGLGDAYINQHIALARPRECFDHRYIAWYLASEADGKRRLLEKSRGGTKAGLGLDDIRNVDIPIAPRAEQTRIADKLDTVLTRVDACRDRLARVAPLLKRFRQSVLAAATSGRLTEDWRDGAEVEWKACCLGDLLDGKPRNGYSPKAVDYETDVRSLTLSATTTGKFLGEHSKFIDEKFPLDSHLWLKPGDVLVQRANSLEYVGVSAIFDGAPDTFIYPDLMMKCQPNKLTTSRFLHLVLSSEPVRNYFRSNATGTAGNMPKINQQTVISAPCRLPPLTEQTEIVRRVETLFAFADRLEARLKTAQAAADRLTPALLAKAFRGELVPQDPNDEPAAELLKRLAASRDAAPKAKRGRRSATA